MPPENLKKLTARIVPVDPLLSRVDAATGRMRFYWARASRSPACTLSCRVDGTDARATAKFDTKDYASVALGKLKPGEHRISVEVGGSDGALLASNAYRIVAGTWKDPSRIGRRLNNFVTELVNAPLKDGEVSFERAEDGWTWICLDGDIGEAKGYLDDSADCVVCRREGEPVVEAQRYLKAGPHRLRIRNAKGGRLRIHAVKIVMGGSLKGYDRTDCVFENFGGFVFGLPFLRKYGMLSSVNVLSSDGKLVARQLANPFSTAIWNCLARGMQISRSTLFSPMDKDRLSEEATYRHIDSALWDGFVASVSVDENALRAPSLHSVNFSEAVWRIHEENPQNALNLFYCDTSEGVVYDEPRQNVSEIASVVNTGDGRGLLCPEFYMPVTPDRAAFRDFIDANADFIAAALEMVPASRGKTIMYGSSYIMLGEWCNYYAPETDIKVQTADLMRAYAVDPRFAECAGMGFGGIGCGNEEYVRWSMKLMRYYALEGGTEDVAAKYGYAWNPGFVKDPDFAKGFESWQAKPAEEGSLVADRIHQYGMRYQHRVGAPTGFGDTMAKFTVSKSGPNVLSQKLTGLKPGACYSLQFNITDRMSPDEKGDMWKLTARPLTFAARLEGAEEVKDLRYSHPLIQTPAVPEEDRKRSMMHNERYVFRATTPEATLVFTDREGSGPSVDVGRSYLLNYVIFAPYYCEDEADVRDIAATIRGETAFPASAEARAEDFRIRDPFVLADAKTKTYYLYGVEHYLGEKCDETGVWVRKSADLKTWSEPQRVMSAPKGIQCVWAPEVHEYKGAYYMFATLKEHPDPNKPLVMMGPTPDWSSNMSGGFASWHAVWIYRAERPEGPFLPVSDKPITPPGWIALDGTLAVEDGKPYLVFTHDWAQVADGTIELAPLTDDLSALAAPPKTLFRASTIAPGTLKGVTDGPFVYRSPESGKLFITWSTHNPAKLKLKQGGYCVVSSESASGRLEGPWVNHHIIFDANGGHGMTFRAFDGSRKFVLHKPERWGSEHLTIYGFTDDGKGIGIAALP